MDDRRLGPASPPTPEEFEAGFARISAQLEERNMRCKFTVQSITEYPAVYQYTLTPVYGSEENKKYWESTPSGSFQVSVVKTHGKLFHVGGDYFIDVSEAV